jgi:hypothetical protein
MVCIFSHLWQNFDKSSVSITFPASALVAVTSPLRDVWPLFASFRQLRLTYPLNHHYFTASLAADCIYSPSHCIKGMWAWINTYTAELDWWTRYTECNYYETHTMNIFTITVSPFLWHMRPHNIYIYVYKHIRLFVWYLIEFQRYFRNLRYKCCKFMTLNRGSLNYYI